MPKFLGSSSLIYACCVNKLITLLNIDTADDGEDENEELKAAFESYKSKTYALTVPLRIVALRNSVPPLWIKVISCFSPHYR